MRVIATTNRDMLEEVREKKFREEAALVKQAFVKDQEKTVEQYASANGGDVTGFLRIEI